MSNSRKNRSTARAKEFNNRRPTPPGEILRYEIIEENRITQEKLADAMGVSRLTVNQLVNNRRSITSETALRLGKATSTSPDFWLNLQRAVDLYDARKKLAEVFDHVKVLLPPMADEDYTSTKFTK